jgi:tripartite-type tricarboxylate transporter receptor subunit TctC
MMIFIKNPRRDSSRDFHLQRSNRRHGMSLIPRRAGLASMVVAALTALTAGAVQAQSAQDYPSKPIRIIAPFPAGSGPDVNTREIAGELGKVLGQSVLVENRPGASNMIGMEAGAKAAADGYTLVMGSTTSLSVVPHLYAKVPYNADKDFAPISLVGLLNTALTANANVPLKNAREAIAQLKSSPESLVAATQGVGSYSHLAGEWFAASSGTKIKFVPYHTTNPYTDVVAGQVNMIFDALPAAISNVRAGKLKILALTGATRHPSFPDVPTFAEAGLADYSPTAWIGLLAPAGTPAPIIEKLSAAMQKAASQNPTLIEKWRTAFIKSDSGKWEKAIKGAGIRLE